jgi:hypothetical protein
LLCLLLAKSVWGVPCVVDCLIGVFNLEETAILDIRRLLEGIYGREDAVVKVVACTDGSLIVRERVLRIAGERTMVRGLRDSSRCVAQRCRKTRNHAESRVIQEP